MARYGRVAHLPVEIESYELEGLEHRISDEFTRRTTVVRLRGAGHEGVGEDVTYSPDDQAAFQEEGSTLPLPGSHTLDSFSQLLDRLSLFPAGPALDLALRQGGLSLAKAVGRTPQPVNFVVSLRLPEPPTPAPVLGWLEHYPKLRFKLDPTSTWDDAVVTELQATKAVDTLDLKGQYKGTPVDQSGDATLYARVATAFPEAWLEDPTLNEDTDPVLEPHRERITWDAPIHSVADITGLPFPPRMVNIKPSRFGSVRELFDTYDYCAKNNIGMYGGGQFELGPGRGQIQYLASLFHPSTPNDVAPAVYNVSGPGPGLPQSPLQPAPSEMGFRWGDAG